MLVNTKAIVLHQTKYSDSSVILHLYTEKLGRVPVMAYGLSGKHGKKPGLFQPLFLVDTVLYQKTGREVQKLKEFKLDPPLPFMASDIVKTTMALFLADVLYHSLREEAHDPPLFSFLSSSIQSLDAIFDNTHLFHLVFLTRLMRYLGFGPEPSPNAYLNLKTGHAEPSKTYQSAMLTPPDFALLTAFYNTPYNQLGQLAISNSQKETILAALVTLYEHHLIHLKSFKSYQVMQQIFE
jgi:DNA repair protein RecO (recombination protein O)